MISAPPLGDAAQTGHASEHWRCLIAGGPAPCRAIRSYGDKSIPEPKIPAGTNSDCPGHAGSLHGGKPCRVGGEILTPFPDRAIALQSNAQIASCGDRDHVAKSLDLYRLGTVSGRAVSELPIVIRAPHPDGSILSQRNGMKRMHRDRGDISQSGHLYRDNIEYRAYPAIRKQAIVVRAPSPDRAILLERNRVADPSAHSNYVSNTRYLNRTSAVCRRAVTQLTAVILSPRPDSAILFNGKRMKMAAGDGTYRHQAGDRDRDSGIQRAARPKLPE